MITPKKREKINSFLQRCIADPTMIKDFKNGNDRLLICSKIYRDGTI
jgi:hypothetical protein